MGLAYLVGRLDHVLNQRLREALAPAGLSVPQYTALSVFRAHGALSNAQLATRTMISPQSANEMVKQMEAKGWIARTPDPAHGRIIQISLTEAGQSFLSANEGALKEAVERLGSLRERSQARDRHRQAGEDGLDRNILEVLAVYHERIEREQEERKAARETGKEFSRDNRLLAVGPKTGRFINILARSLESPTILELGTSFGYSAIWLGEAARATGGRLITMELSPEKSEQARQMSEKAGLAEHVDFRVGDAVELINSMPERVDFVLVDLWNHLYEPCLAALASKLNPGAILVADNIRPGDPGTAPYIAALRAIPGMQSVPLPVGSGLEVSRYLP